MELWFGDVSPSLFRGCVFLLIKELITNDIYFD